MQAHAQTLRTESIERRRSMEQQYQEEMEEENHARALPEDVLADVLLRLAPRDLAASRRVCTAWRAVVDGHRLLRPDLLPRTLGGVFVDFNMGGRSEFFRAPTPTTTIVSGDLGSFMPKAPNVAVDGHCGGLLLIPANATVSVVVNPATRQWATLPPQPPPPRMASFADPYLAYDPAVSPCYEVFLMPVVGSHDDATTAAESSSEWPPSVCETHVFSSRTGRWEERHLVREGGEPAGTMADMIKDSWVMEKRYSVYSRGALYVHSQNDFFCRVSLASNTYRVIKPPVQQQITTGRPDSSTDQQSCLGRLANTVCLAILDEVQLRVWTLVEAEESSMEWVLKHQHNANDLLASRDLSWKQRGDHDQAWILEDKIYDNAHFGDYYDTDDDEQGDYHYAQQPHVDEEPDELGGCISFLGFHPFQEVVFFYCNALRRGVAYDLSTSKVRDLGNMLPKSPEGQHTAYIASSFPYTPCWMEDSLPTTH